MRVLASTPAGVVCTILALALAQFGAADRAVGQPTEEQVAAIKSNCRSDYMSYCWSVPRGGSEAAQCLKQNLAKLSPGCQQAVKAATAAAAPPSAPAPEKPATPPAQQAPSSTPAATAKIVATPAPEPAPQTQVGSDQGAPAAAAPAAKAAAPAPVPAAASKTAAQTPATEAAPAATVKAPSATQAAPPAEPDATTAAVPPSSPSPPGFIPPGKKLMLARNCRHDFKVFCPDVDLGGGRAVVCLEDNKAQLTPDCRDALAKLGR